ncbi:MBL fold metallo-hydrolase [Rhodovulum visakhapatnamense]|uniref:Glyoxylase-like metal-dependent hydrolase (Beta-lactamase superfamily II) n=1 Tax=Rhodovulum visakhapatnamense TaxID=364297 RepID=A0A4V3GTV0_9RHOB|nr:MBL fold metallo-hydrolase [Rhodovulum visakhapatnamense]TDX28003.1 glyoxylase-like metal-dependent hydrolase (beta-lactamase superfamily II) [Rhodovulum visakhapatnamense]
MTEMTRRHALLAGAALPLCAAAAPPARAAAPMMGPARPPFNRFTLGAFEVTTILAGTRTVPDPQTIFGLNVEPERFAAVSEAAMIPADRAQFFFTPTVVNTGSELILFDTGLAPQGTVAALAAAGYTPDQIDTVVITHMHGDHIGGLMEDGAETFSKARYVTGAVEFDAWDMSGDEGFEAKVRPLADKTRFLDDDGEAAQGVTAVAAFGHTPGHMAYRLESEGKALLIGADFANHYVWSLAHPDWEVRYDRDKAAAAATRRRLLDMLAAERMPFIGYHMPFPALGYVEALADGYRYMPASYQMMLD